MIHERSLFNTIYIIYLLLVCFVFLSFPADAISSTNGKNAPDIFSLTDFLLKSVEASQAYDDANKELLAFGFIAKDNRYFTGYRISAYEYEYSNEIKNIESTMLNSDPDPGSWGSYTGHLLVNGEELRAHNDSQPILWVTSIQDGGSLHLLQASAYMCPDRLLAKFEIDSIINMFRKKYLDEVSAIEQQRKINDSVSGYDILWPFRDKARNGYRHRITLYFSQIKNEKYQLFIECSYTYSNEVLKGELVK